MTARTVRKPDIDVIVPDVETISVAGIECRVRRLRSREFLTLLKVITKGLGPAIQSVKLSPDDPEELQGQLIGLFLLAVPNAIDEFAEFMFSIVEPVKSSDQPALTREMVNPDLEVLLDVLARIAEQEAGDLTVLSGKARAAISRVQMAYRNAG